MPVSRSRDHVQGAVDLRSNPASPEQTSGHDNERVQERCRHPRQHAWPRRQSVGREAGEKKRDNNRSIAAPPEQRWICAEVVTRLPVLALPGPQQGSNFRGDFRGDFLGRLRSRHHRAPGAGSRTRCALHRSRTVAAVSRWRPPPSGPSGCRWPALRSGPALSGARRCAGCGTAGSPCGRSANRPAQLSGQGLVA